MSSSPTPPEPRNGHCLDTLHRAGSFLLALDLGVFHRTAHVVSFRESLAWSAGWLTLGLAFAAVVFVAYENKWCGPGTHVDPVDGVVNSGALAAEKYQTGYVVEKSLSIDNIFVIAMIFSSLAVPPIYQHRVLFWGVLGALVMRAAMIIVGAKLIAEFHWVLYVFAGFLILTAVRILFAKSEHADPGQSLLVRLCRLWFPVTDEYHGQRFVVPVPRTRAAQGAAALWALTPLALIMVEAGSSQAPAKTPRAGSRTVAFSCGKAGGGVGRRCRIQ